MDVPSLSAMLSRLSVRRRPGAYRFVDLAEVAVGTEILATVVEDEGTTAVVAYESGDDADFVAAWLVVEVDSALDAVGLTAALSTALATAGIACNVLAGRHHDHLLVPIDAADAALVALAALRNRNDPPEPNASRREN